MRIDFERSGGFMGMFITTTVDTASLPADEALNLQEMVKAASFFELPEVMSTTPDSPDQFQYKLTVEDEGREHSVETTDTAAPDELRPLLRQLTILARSRPE